MNAVEIINPSLPYQREIQAVAALVHEAYLKRDFLALVLVEQMQHGTWILQRMNDSVKWMEPDGFKIFREGIEIPSRNSRIVVHSVQYPESIMGLRPNKIVIFGRMAELWYHINSMGAELEFVA